MKSFKNMFKSNQKFKICLFEGIEQYWPVIDGWTQGMENMYPSPETDYSNLEVYMIDYYNDKKGFIVTFTISKNTYTPDFFEGNWALCTWGQADHGILKSEKSVKSVLKKAEILYEKFKAEAIKKIPIISEWKRIINDYEISYSKKQNDRTVMVKIVNIGSFIRNGIIGGKVYVFDDSMNDRVTEKNYYIDLKRTSLKTNIFDLNDKFFKK